VLDTVVEPVIAPPAAGEVMHSVTAYALLAGLLVAQMAPAVAACGMLDVAAAHMARAAATAPSRDPALRMRREMRVFI